MLAVRWKMLFNKLAFYAFCYSYPTLLELVVAYFVVTLVSAIVRKLALKEAQRFGSNESAYLTCLCVARAQIPPIFLIGQDTARVCIALF
jgi:Na+-translocating ferredoxin:NAD+ oxidoreductase RnfD subunit